MNAVTRRVYEMCVRVLRNAAAHPDDEAGSAALLGRLQAVAGRIAQVVTEQRNGLIDSRAASVRKSELRRTMLAVPIAHLAQIGALASREQHELRSTFLFKPSADTYLAFQTAATGMLAAAQAHRDVLVKHGLSASVLEEFGRTLEQFEAAVTMRVEGRTAHTAATRELAALTKEVGKIVRAMDARNRHRFQSDRQALEQRISARTVLGSPRGTPGDAETEAPAGGGTPEAGGSVRPAA